MVDKKLKFYYGTISAIPQSGNRIILSFIMKKKSKMVRAEEGGFDDIWLSEHHFLEDCYSPSMLAIGCAIAVKTKRIRIGTSVLLLPLHDPVRVAEDAATLDVISGGRLELGLGVGYKVEELKAWGIEPKSRGRRMEEDEIIQRLFAGERFSFQGEFHNYEDIQLRLQYKKA